MPRACIIDPAQLDFDHPLVDLDEIRRVNPQRHEMEQLTAILYVDPTEHVIAGYKDVRLNEFWVRGHMPGYPLMPGVLMCEAAAQLCSYFTTTHGLLAGDFIAFGGMENVKFRSAVRPGDRVVLAARAVELRPGRRAIFYTQGIVQGKVVFEANIIGVPFRIPRRRKSQRSSHIKRRTRGDSRSS